MSRPSADAAIMQFIVLCGIAPSIVEKPVLRNIITALRDAGPLYLPPKRHDFGVNAHNLSVEAIQENPDKLGRVLFTELKRVRAAKAHLLSGLSCIGGTLCNDGAKWRKRSLINSVLITPLGAFFAQSTDATGHFKDAQYILDDIISAIANVGEENVFIVALDGACKKTMRLIWERESMHKIFPQRCSTHGCNLLIADIGKLFLWEINLCVRLVKFILNHDAVYALFKKMPNTLMLLGTCETRFASHIYSVDRIVADKDQLQQFWTSAELRSLLQLRSSTDLKAEHTSLRNDFILNEQTWSRVSVFLDVEVPIRTALRISDSNAPNLGQMAQVFERSIAESMKGAMKAEGEFPAIYPDLAEKIRILCDRRRVDVVTKLCLAAAMVYPKKIYTADGEVYAPEGGKAAINDVIQRYYPSISDQLKAIVVLNNLRSKTGLFADPRMKLSADTSTPDDFYIIACSLSDEVVGLELYRKLINGYSGQGESERMNKQVKKHRTTVRNQQHHAATSALMELESTYKMIENRREQPAEVLYIDRLKETFRNVQEEIAIDAAEESLNDALARDASADYASDDEDDIDYDAEVPDMGRNALIDLLIHAASTIAGNDANDTYDN